MTAQGRPAWRCDSVKTKKNSTLRIILTGRVLLLFERLLLCYEKPLWRVACFAEQGLATSFVFLLLLSLSTTEATALHLAHDLADLVKLLDEPIDLCNGSATTVGDALAA